VNSISRDAKPPKAARDLLEVAVLTAIATTSNFVSHHFDANSPAGNRAAMAGVLTAIAWAFLATRLRGDRFVTLGIARPTSWKRTILLALAGTVVLFVVGGLLQALVLPLFLDQTAADTSRFDAIRGNPLELVRVLLVVWVTAAFGEEVVYRGFLIPRLARLFGDGRHAGAIAVVVGAVGFGFLHLYQGAAGVILTGWTGIVLGALYLLADRNIWAAVFAHGLTHLVSFSLLAAGALPG
jgi:membrane protease YdiL (CAAX protease family)